MSKLYKFISWEIAVIIFSWLFWRGFSRFAGEFSAGASGAGSFSFSSGFTADVVVYFLILAVVACLGIMFFGKIWQVLLSGALAGGVFLLMARLPAQTGFTEFNLAAVGILLLFLFYARLNIVSESKERTKINARIILSRGLAPIILALLLMASLVIYQSPGVKALEKASKIPPAGEKFVNSVIENFIGNLIEGSPKEKQTVAKEISRQTINQINAIAGPYFKFAPPVLTAALFLMLWGFHGIFVWLGVLIGWPLFFVLKKAKFARIEERDTKAETLII